MTTYVEYMYRVPGASEDVKIRSESWPDKTQADVLPLIASVGDLTTVWPDDPIEHGEAREFKVLEYQPGPITYWVENSQSTVSNVVVVVVTDPDE